MRHSPLSFAAFAILAVIGGMLGQQLTSSPAIAGPAPAKEVHRVAVANIGKLFLKADRTKERKEALKKASKKTEKQLNDKLKLLQARRKRLESGRWDKDSPIYREQLKDLVGRFEALKGELAWERELFQMRMRKEAERLYEQIVKEVASYAKEQKFDLVLQIDEVPQKSASDRAFSAKVNRRKTLYHSKAIDITNAVLKRLNQ